MTDEIKIHTMADDARTVANAICGYWPGLEDMVQWGTEDERMSRSAIWRAANRILKNQYPMTEPAALLPPEA